MNKYIGPKLKLIRKLGFLPGFTQKIIKKRLKTPGQHGILQEELKKVSLTDDYKQKLIEKQKVKYNYIITEKQLINYYLKAKQKKNLTGILFLQAIESRLDCIIYRLGYSSTILEARQLINHGHILVNKKKITITSFNCKLNDIIQIKNNSLQRIINNFTKQYQNQNFLHNYLKEYNLIEYNFLFLIPTHLEINIKTYEGKIISNIKQEELLININNLKIMEYYS